MESVKQYLWFFFGILAILIIVGVTLLYMPIAAISQQLHEPITLATPLDLSIPLVPSAIIIYWYVFYAFIFFSWLYLSFVQREYRNALVTAFVVISFVAYVIYLLMPVQGPERAVTGTDFFSTQIQLLYNTDTHVNCFPSLHGSYSLLSAYGLWRAKKEYGYIAWPTAIAVQVSTLFVRQHWIADQLAAALITLVIAYLIFDKLKYTRVERNTTEVPDIKPWKIVLLLAIAIMFMILYVYTFAL
ncbi:MAG: phosphatase PAP2 family protein [Candidatus Thorarchaeota archaeon]